MAEYPLETTKILAEIFCAEYNKRNKTEYKWSESSYQNHEPFDFVLLDKKKELGVQLTRAVADKERELIRWAKAEPVIRQLELLLTENKKMPKLFLFFNFYNLPKNKEERDNLVFWLEFFISSKVSNSLRLSYFTYDSDFDDEYLATIKKYIDDIDIAPNKDREKKIISMWSVSRKGVEPWPAENIKLINAVRLKEDKYKDGSKDVILLIDAGMFPVDDYYEEEAKKQLTDSLFKEIWLVENFVGRERAVKLK